jgi:hypothetical protein
MPGQKGKLVRKALCLFRLGNFSGPKEATTIGLASEPSSGGQTKPHFAALIPSGCNPLSSLYERLVRTCRRTFTSGLHIGEFQLSKMVFPQPAGLQKGKETNRSSLSSLANHLRSLLVLAHSDEGAMTQVPGVRPFYESDLAYQLWVDPAALFHFLSG